MKIDFLCILDPQPNDIPNRPVDGFYETIDCFRIGHFKLSYLRPLTIKIIPFQPLISPHDRMI